MNPSPRFSRLAVLALSALTLTGCAPMKVHSFAAQSPAFSTYHTYGWADDGARTTGDPRLDNNPFFQSRIETDTDQHLAARGLEKVTTGTPDLLLHYHASVTQKLDVAATDQQYGYCEDCHAASVYDAGTVLLDFVDTHTNTLVWRGWAEMGLDGVIDNQDWLEAKVDEAIARIVATIPSRM